MSRLLSAGYKRLFRNKLLIAAIIMIFLFGIFAGYSRYDNKISGLQADLVDLLFSFGYLVPIALAAVIPMFSGTEYSDGTIRNKIIAGHKRIDIYLSNLILSVTAGILTIFAFLLPYTVFCLLTIGPSAAPIDFIIWGFAVDFIAFLALCAIFNAITMLLSKKAAAAVSCLLLVLIFFILATYLYAGLSQPEMYEGYSLSVDGKIVSQLEPNPKYLTGLKRQIYETIYDILPFGQIYQVLLLEMKYPAALALYSLAITLIVTAAGIYVFKRKDLK